jgi:hypothetical protein
MVLFKEKKRKVSKKQNRRSQKTTLDHKHTEMLNNLKSKQKEIPNLEKKLKSLNKSLSKYLNIPNKDLSEEELDNKLNIKEQISTIQTKIDKLRSNREKNCYLLDTSLMLYHYFDENNVYVESHTKQIANKKTNSKKTVLDFFSSNKTIPVKKSPKNKERDRDVKTVFKNKKQIMESYMSIVDKHFVKNINHLTNEEIDMCKNCNEPRIFDPTHGVLICPICGVEEKILIDSDTPSYKEPPREITYFAYKKINHANEFLSQFQAKESTDIANEIFEKIVDELKKESYLNIKNIKPNKIREILKKLELTKYYEHCHYITNRLTGKPAPTITTELEEKLRNMFKEVQGPWMKFCPNERANFFSYPYIFYKFFQLLEKDQYLPYCRLLKSREKLQEHDEVWRRICHELRWQFIPTV